MYFFGILPFSGFRTPLFASFGKLSAIAIHCFTGFIVLEYAYVKQFTYYLTDAQSAGKESIMKKVICKVEYDTEASELIQKKVVGVFGDPKGYEESLYKTKEGKFFLYGFGGPESPYTEETIKRLAADKVKAWQKA